MPLSLEARPYLKLEQMRYLLRLCKDLELFSLKRYEYISREINETGSFIGGWVKQQKGQTR